jgi:hypothetical protein
MTADAGMVDEVDFYPFLACYERNRASGALDFAAKIFPGCAMLYILEFT